MTDNDEWIWASGGNQPWKGKRHIFLVQDAIYDIEYATTLCGRRLASFNSAAGGPLTKDWFTLDHRCPKCDEVMHLRHPVKA